MSVYAQKITVIGTVKDKDGKPIAAATVTEKGTTNSTLTDPEGFFKIDVYPGSVLAFKMSKYRKKEVSVDNSNTINVVLMPDMRESVFGFTVGPNYSFAVSQDYLGDFVNNIQPFYGFNAGIFMGGYFSRNFALEFGLKLDKKGFEETQGDYTGTSTMYYATIPIPFYCRFDINMRKHKILFTVGTECGFCFKGVLKDKFNNKQRETNIVHDCYVSPGFAIGTGYESPIGIGLRGNYSYWTMPNAKIGIHTLQAALTYCF